MNVYVVIVIQILFASGTHIVGKTVVGDVDPLVLTFFRGVLSAAGLALLVAMRGRWIAIERQDRFRFILLGFLATINQFLYLFGLRSTTAANAALLYATTPVFVLLISRSLLGERMTLRKTAGIVIAVAGVSIVIFERGVSFSADHTIGDLIVLTAVVAWALFTILGKGMVLRYGALQATAAANFMGLALLFPFGAAASWRYPIGSLPAQDWLGIVYLGIGTSIIGYLLWYYALRRIEASQLAVFANGQPVMATVFSVIFLNYVVTPLFAVGGIITIAGVVLAQLRRPSSG
jgi:drug/metabolite transporter (DMT)-like permease